MLSNLLSSLNSPAAGGGDIAAQPLNYLQCTGICKYSELDEVFTFHL